MHSANGQTLPCGRPKVVDTFQYLFTRSNRGVQRWRTRSSSCFANGPSTTGSRSSTATGHGRGANTSPRLPPQAAALIAAADPQRPLHVGVLMGNTPDMLTALAAAGLGGYVLCGINTTRRGDGLARDITRVDCQIVLTDAEHRHLLDDCELPGVTVIDVSTGGLGGPRSPPRRRWCRTARSRPTTRS